LFRTLLGCLLLTALIAPPAFATTSEDTRLNALLVLVRLRQEGAQTRVRDDYRKVEELFARGDALAGANRTDEADGIFARMAETGEELMRQLIATSPSPTGPAAQVVTAAAGPAGDASADEDDEHPQSDWLVGGESIYIVEKSETLRSVGAKVGVNWRQLARLNGLDPQVRLKPGQEIRFNNLRIIPKQVASGIVVNIPDRTLYYFRNGRLERTIPVAVGRPKGRDGEPVWQTPVGRFKVVGKAKNPVWRVPPSIQAEMAEERKKVVDLVPSGQKNPLGKYAIYTSLSGILLHSTNLPASIYGYSSHGCIRIAPSEMEAFFRQVRVNTPGEIIYKPVKLAVTDEGRVYIEVHRDVYEKVKDLRKEVHRLVASNGVEDRVDWGKVTRVLKTKSGVAEDVSL